MKHLKIIICGILASMLVSSCALLFSSKREKVFITTATPGANIVYHDDTIGNDHAKIRVNKKKLFQGVTVTKDGYKTGHYCMGDEKRSPLYALSILDIIALGPAWEGRSPKLHKYKKKQIIPALTPVEYRKADEKYLFVESTAVDAKGGDIIYKRYLKLKEFKKITSADHKKWEKQRWTTSSQDDIKIDNTVFSDDLNRLLKKMAFIDTTQTIFPNTGNCLFVKSTIKKFTLHDIAAAYDRDMPNYLTPVNKVVCVEMQIEWELLDYYKQKVYTLTTNKKSDPIIIEREKGDNSKLISRKIGEAIKDDLEYSLIEARKELSQKGLLTITAGKADTSATIAINKPAQIPNQRMNDFLKSSVTVKVDDGHGSGVIISADGVIVTNYHVIAGSKKIEVIFNDGSKADAEVIKYNSNADLALIKVKKDSLVPLIFNDTEDPEIGVDVWAIGTPKSLELGQSVSKGIISGIRNANGITYLQTDVKVSPGNSGGALINKEGKVLGLVSSKLIGFGTEGVAFAILSKNLFSQLKLQYK